ncbi:hypothetical protein L6R52_33475, partial [Myxococcota bacterium]|nr:hypothetical protein [Myxococcota bacterium]
SGDRVDCGRCGDHEICAHDGFENVCCAPTRCEEQQADCGSMSDGCGGTLDCGTCPTGQVCGGGGVPNVCGTAACRPTTCDAEGVDCGRISDGCGGVVDCGTCAGGMICGGDGTPNHCSVPSTRPAIALARGCLGQPTQALTPLNQTPVRVGLWAGTKAIDFALADVRGERVVLTQLLKSAPVVLELGARTCGNFNWNSEGMDRLAKKFRGKAHFVTVYVIEPHPTFPDASPFRGRPFKLHFSDASQPRSYAERRAHGAATQSKIAPERRVLVDDLDNPVWCTYGPAPNAAFIIRQDGVIEAAHPWLHVESLEGSLEALLDRMAREKGKKS